MSWFFKLNGSSGANTAEVNTSNEVKSVTDKDRASVGIHTENDAGTVTGSKYMKSPETSTDYRLRVGLDTVLFSDTFNASAQNTHKWSYTFNTLTAAQPGAGTVNFSAVQGTTSSHGAFMRSFQYFPLIGTAPLSFEITFGQFTSALSAGEVWLCGFGLPSAATTRPTDGIWFKLTSAGLVGVLAYNGSETETGVLYAFGDLSLGELDKFMIVVGKTGVEWWKQVGEDDILLDHTAIPSANGQPFIQGSLPAFMMKYNTGAVSNTNTMRVSDLTVSLMDITINKPYAVQAATAGSMAYVGQNGQTQGTTQNVGTITTGSTPNLPTSAAGSNTTPQIQGLGGWGAINAAAGAATDFIASSYTNPASTVNITGRNLIVTGIYITAINTGAAVATTPTTLLWSIAFGHLADTLNATESSSFATGTTHVPRRVQLGFQSAAVGTAVGGLYSNEIYRDFGDGPIVVRPGERFALIMKIVVGTATASQTITYNITPVGYFE